MTAGWPLWRAWLLQPSLLRRLLLAQLLLLVLLWLAMIVYVVYQSQHDDSELAVDQRYAMILLIGDQLADRPQQRRAALAEIDRFQRQTEGIESEPDMRISMLVRQQGALVFASPGVPENIVNAVPGRLEKVQAGGRRWRARTIVSPASDLAVTLVKPAEAINVVMAFGSHGVLLLPLLISLPFLAVPAWLSMRLALRPWRQLSAEVASRGPEHLAPLAFAPRHRELAPLVRSIDALLRRVRESARREREFIADAAHELRTPLAAMKVNVEALQASETLSMEPAHRELLAGTLRSGERASHGVAQLIALMRADLAPVGDARFERVALRALVQDRLASFAGLAGNKAIELELEAAREAWIDGERHALMSLLDNLIDNAVKYSPAGSTVQVRVGLAEPSSAAWLVVRDQGPGIPNEFRARVFDRFFRLADATQSGSGLGLAIVKAVADRHRALIELEAGADGRGLCVQVRFKAPGTTANL